MRKKIDRTPRMGFTANAAAISAIVIIKAIVFSVLVVYVVG